MKTLFILLICIVAIQADAQEKKIAFRVYVSPAICLSPVERKVFTDGKETVNKLTKTPGFFFGAGFEALKPLKNNWFIAGDIGFLSKGYYAVKSTTYQNNRLIGTSFKRTDLNYLQPMIFVEKQIPLKNANDKIIFSTGLFYGLHINNLINFGLEAKKNDVGNSLSIGIQRKSFFTKLDFQKGWINVKNTTGSSFKTNVVSFKIGSIL